MKILHTSDWHIGHNFFKIDRSREFKDFFEWLLKTIQEEGIDILLVSGDIFDTYNPSNEALKLYYDFLNRCKELLKKVIIIGGNHDSVKNLIAPKEILKILDIVVVSGAEDDFCEVVEFDDFNIVAISYLRDGILSKNSLKELYSSKLNKTKKNIAMGHLTISGSKFGESEREIGGLETISNTIFEGYDYVALGHIHKPQKITENIVYSGSPLSLNFNENYKKQIVILESDTMEYKFLEVPKFREFFRLKGDFEKIKTEIKKLPSESFVEIEFNEVVSSFDLEEIEREDIYIVKKSIPYKTITKRVDTKKITPKDLIQEIFGDDEDFEEIKKIVQRLKDEN